MKYVKFPYAKPPVAENGVVLGANDQVAKEFSESIHSERLRSFSFDLL